MNYTTATTIPARCANLRCPNTPGEGAFVLVETEETVNAGPVGPWPHGAGGMQYAVSHDVALFLCAPCANVLGVLLDGER